MSLNIKKEREIRGMTQEEFAEFLGVNRKTIVSYESGGNIPETKIKMFTRLLSQNSHLDQSSEEDLNNTPSKFYNSKGKKVSDKEICEYMVRNFEKFKEGDIGLKKSIEIEALKLLIKAKKPDGTIDIDKIGN
ncbi:helix-turn-helix transcriptional regulator [Aquimarina megaterium]|uniref:helix-turn-helix transcriptional regulator n=1 Tax=Aquimarina megaterium TaxID=1443666 RepID=UPI00094574C7|nr:helix-turn-helix transcriptional regulator [Aquimarina megaterium]